MNVWRNHVMPDSQNDDSQIQISKKLVAELYTFIATTNNYLMSIPVQGDKILQSAELMKKANELFEQVKELND